VPSPKIIPVTLLPLLSYVGNSKLPIALKVRICSVPVPPNVCRKMRPLAKNPSPAYRFTSPPALKFPTALPARKFRSPPRPVLGPVASNPRPPEIVKFVPLLAPNILFGNDKVPSALRLTVALLLIKVEVEALIVPVPVPV